MTIIEKLENMDRKLRVLENKGNVWFDKMENKMNVWFDKMDAWFETTIRNLCIRYLSTSKK